MPVIDLNAVLSDFDAANRRVMTYLNLRESPSGLPTGDENFSVRLVSNLRNDVIHAMQALSIDTEIPHIALGGSVPTLDGTVRENFDATVKAIALAHTGFSSEYDGLVRASAGNAAVAGAVVGFARKLDSLVERLAATLFSGISIEPQSEAPAGVVTDPIEPYGVYVTHVPPYGTVRASFGKDTLIERQNVTFLDPVEFSRDPETARELVGMVGRLVEIADRTDETLVRTVPSNLRSAAQCLVSAIDAMVDVKSVESVCEGSR